MDGKSWIVVQFIDDKSVEAVPSGWVQGDICHWPPLAPEKLTTAIKKCEPLNTYWPAHRVKTFRHATYDDYGKAREKSRLAMFTSDIASSDTSMSNKRKRRIRVLTSSDDSSDTDIEPSQLPTPPKLNKHIFKDKKKSIVGASQSSTPPQERPQATTKDDYVTEIIIESSQTTLENPSFLHRQGMSSVSSTPRVATNKDLTEKDQNVKQLIEQNYILRSIMAETLEEVKRIRSDLDTLLMQNRREEKEYTNFFTQFPHITFPIDSEEDLKALEEVLQMENNFEHAIKECSRFGGSNTYDFVKRVLTSLITNSIALKYSFFGRKGKEAFKNLKLTNLIIMSAERAKKCSSHHEVEIAIGAWLRRASDRRTAVQKKFAGSKH